MVEHTVQESQVVLDGLSRQAVTQLLLSVGGDQVRIDAVDLSSSMATQQHANAAGFERALEEFLADCRARERCAFDPGDDPAQSLEELRRQLESGMRIETAGGRSVGITEFYFALLVALYTPDGWPFLARSLQDAVVERDGTGLEALSDAYAGRNDDGTYSNFQEVLGVIVCDDQPEALASFDAFRESYASFARDYPFFGPLLSGSPLGCDPRLPRPRADDRSRHREAAQSVCFADRRAADSLPYRRRLRHFGIDLIHEHLSRCGRPRRIA